MHSIGVIEDGTFVPLDSPWGSVGRGGFVTLYGVADAVYAYVKTYDEGPVTPWRTTDARSWDEGPVLPGSHVLVSYPWLRMVTAPSSSPAWVSRDGRTWDQLPAPPKGDPPHEFLPLEGGWLRWHESYGEDDANDEIRIHLLGDDNIWHAVDITDVNVFTIPEGGGVCCVKTIGSTAFVMVGDGSATTTRHLWILTLDQAP